MITKNQFRLGSFCALFLNKTYCFLLKKGKIGLTLMPVDFHETNFKEKV